MDAIWPCGRVCYSDGSLPWPVARRRVSRAAANARIVAGGLRRRWHRLLSQAYNLRRHLHRHHSVRSITRRVPPTDGRRAAGYGGAANAEGPGGRRGRKDRGRARHLPGSGPVDAPLPFLPTLRPSRRNLDNNDLSGSNPRSWGAHRAEVPVSHRTSAPPPWQGRGREGTKGVWWRCRGSLRVALAALCICRRSPMTPLRRPSRRNLYDNNLSGSLPSQLGRLTALTKL